MREIRSAIDAIEKELRSRNIAKYSFVAEETRKHEFNMASGEFTLLRTTFGNNFNIQVFPGECCGSALGNDFTDEGLRDTIASAVSAAESAEPDKDKDFAPFEGHKTETFGVVSPDKEHFFERIREFQATVEKEYPMIQMGDFIGYYSNNHSIYKNTNGTEFDETSGFYQIFCSMAGNDGNKTTGCIYMEFETDNLDKPFMEYEAVRRQFDSARDQLNVIPVTGKFTGTVVLSPVVMFSFTYMLMENYVSDSTILDGTSMWRNKMGQKVTDSRLTLAIDDSTEGIVREDMFTSDGFLCEPVNVIENGVLKNFVIDLYTANKCGLTPTRNVGNAYVVRPGEDSYEDMIKSVKKGILLGDFSGGEPGANGEFSGVAKNSYYIEDGQIKGAVSEVMISGNLETMFNSVTGISKEVVCDGMSSMPFVAVEGITITGK